MTDINHEYIYGEEPSWERIKNTLLLGGLGFWRMVRDSDGNILFGPHDTLLAILGIKRSDMPRYLDQIMTLFFSVQGGQETLAAVRDCFAGKSDSFNLEHQIFILGCGQEMWLRTFGDVEERDSQGRVMVISGFSQNVQNRHEINARLKTILKEKNAADERNGIMLNSMPMVSDLWCNSTADINPSRAVVPLAAQPDLVNRSMEVMTLMDVNTAALSLFDLPNKEVYFNFYHQLSPKFQPDGRLSEEVISEKMTQVSHEGTIVFEWMHQKLDGTPIPCEVTLTRVLFDGDYILLNYKRDLRELKATQSKLEMAQEEAKAAHERTRLMLDTMPFGCDFWEITPPADELSSEMGARLIDVNTAALALFGMQDKETYLNNFHILSPKYQPNGRLSAEMCHELINQTLQEGRVTLDWMHQTAEGVPIPSEVTLIRVPYGEKITVIGYSSDLRELLVARTDLDMALEDSKIAHERTSIMLNSLPIICNFWSTNSHNIDTTDRWGIPITGQPDKQLHLIDVNQVGLNLFDMTDKQHYFRTFYTLSPKFQPNGRLSEELFLEMFDKAILEGCVTFEWLHQKHDETFIPFEVTLIRVPSDDEVTVVSYGRDLRELKAAKAELDVALEETKTAHERTQIMLNTMPMICDFWDTDPANIDTANNSTISLIDLPQQKVYLTDVNNVGFTFFGIPDKAAYLSAFTVLSPQYQPNGRLSMELASEMMSQAIREGTVTFEWMHQKLDGTLIPSEIILTRVTFGGKVTVVSYGRDLRELKAAQSAMIMERLLLKKIMDTTPICFAITVNDTIKFITPFAEHFTGRTLGDNISEIYINQAAYRVIKIKQAKNNLVSWHTVKVKRADGEIREMLMNSFKTDYYGEAGIMNWFIDITRMRQKNRELYMARKMAEESTKAKSNFLANMSHEIRTPMNAILGLLHLLVQSDLNQVQRDYLVKTEGAAKALLRIINDILDFSKIEAGKLEMEKEIFYLDDVLQNLTDLSSTSFHAKGLEYIVNVQPKVPTGLIGDQGRLGQIISNLINNAVKFTEKGQIVLKIESISESSDQVTLRFLVQDTGIGLSKEQAETLFSAFTQADASTTRRYGGTGLGLVICKRLVEMMDGTIWVESEYGSGSTFGFTAKFGLHSKSPKHYIDTDINFRGLSALVVDDNLVALDCLSIFLKSLGFIVEMAASGDEALDTLVDWSHRNEHFDLVFIDWKMPGMDGIETSSRINQLIAPAELPVIIMATAYSHDEVMGHIKDKGIRNVMTKPLSPSSIVNVLSEIFGGRVSVTQAEAKATKGQEQTLVRDFIGTRILLAEDNEVNQLVASRILKNAGLVVDIANNGLEAVDMAKTGQYQLILMDIQMPEMDGIVATRKIRSIPELKKMPILAMTAHAMSGDREICLQAGMDDHISKPIHLHELFSTLAKWLKISSKLGQD